MSSSPSSRQSEARPGAQCGTQHPGVSPPFAWLATTPIEIANDPDRHSASVCFTSYFTSDKPSNHLSTRPLNAQDASSSEKSATMRMQSPKASVQTARKPGWAENLARISVYLCCLMCIVCHDLCKSIKRAGRYFSLRLTTLSLLLAVGLPLSGIPRPTN